MSSFDKAAIAALVSVVLVFALYLYNKHSDCQEQGGVLVRAVIGWTCIRG